MVEFFHFFQLGVVLLRRKTKEQDPKLFVSIPLPNGEGTGDTLQYSCLEIPMDGGAWWAAVHGIAKSRTQLSNFTFTLLCQKRSV